MRSHHRQIFSAFFVFLLFCAFLSEGQAGDSCPREKIEQMVMLGISVGDPGNNVQGIISRHPHLGGFVFFGHPQKGLSPFDLKNDLINNVNVLLEIKD
jgi:hypothetical protein